MWSLLIWAVKNSRTRFAAFGVGANSRAGTRPAAGATMSCAGSRGRTSGARLGVKECYKGVITLLWGRGGTASRDRPRRSESGEVSPGSSHWPVLDFLPTEAARDPIVVPICFDRS